MRLRREVSLGIISLLGLQILLSVLAIALLARVGPAIEQILEENIYSSEAVEEMLAAMAAPGASTKESVAIFEGALARAQGNITEEAERPLLASIERQKAAAFRDEAEARTGVVEALRELSHVNRDSARKADQQAKRLGLAGAWATAMLGALALGLGIVVYRRLRLRLELPIEDLRRTMQRLREGNLQARCVTTDGPIEVKQIAVDLNWLLDNRLHHPPRAQPAEPIKDSREEDIRRLLAWLLDQRAEPMFVVDDKGIKVACNQSALSMPLPTGGFDGWESVEISGTGLRILKQQA